LPDDAYSLEGVTKTLTAPILMTKAAKEEVEQQVDCTAKGEVPLKGRAGIFVYEVNHLRRTENV